MVKIYLARHGQNIDNANGILNGHRDEPLTELGLKQASGLAHAIKDRNLGIGKVFSSPLSRAYQTAEVVANILNLDKPEKLELLIERDFGVMTGHPTRDIEPLCSPNIIKTNTVTYFLSPEGAETFSELIERGSKLLSLIEAKEYKENILLVCHGDIGKMIYASFYNLPWENVLMQFDFGNTDVLLLDKESKPEERYVVSGRA
jgi:probable phosphoglycerate mutase